MRRRDLIACIGAVAVCPLAVRAQPSAASQGTGAEAGQLGSTRTGKERLGRKSNDEQRIDNCKVPPDLRGPKPRPDDCGDRASAKRLE
jgi:hypothetical protein